jgi:tetratricopeptide (TPR) repeat protein
MKGYLPIFLAGCFLVSACTSGPVEKEFIADLEDSPVPVETQMPTNTTRPTSTKVLTQTSTPPPTFTTAPTINLDKYKLSDLLIKAETQYKYADFEGAIETYTDILGYSLDDEQMKSIYALRAGAYDDTGKRNEALDDYLMAYELGERDSSLINNICWDYSIIEQPEKGLPFCEEAIEIHPTTMGEKDSRALTYTLLGNYEAAIEDLTEVVDSLEAETGIHERLLYRIRSEWLDILKNDENPITPEVLEYLRKPDYIRIAQNFINNENYDAAIKVLSQAIEYDVNKITAHDFRGYAYSQINEPDLAIADFNKVIESGELSANIFYIRATQYAVIGDHENAIVDFNQAIAIEPEHAEAYYRRALVYQSLDDNVQAIEDFNKALELFPEFPDAYGDRGISHFRNGNINDAIADLEKAVELNPENSSFIGNLGAINFYSKKYDQAITYFNKALAIDPGLIDFRNLRASSFIMTGDIENAIEDYDTIIEQDPEYAVAYYFRGLIYFDENEKQKAISDLEQAINLGLPPDMQQAAEDYLEQLEGS